MATIDELVVKIKADIKDLESKMKKADSSVKSSSTKMKKSLDKTGKSASAFSKKMSNAATATAALQGPLGPVAGRMRSFGALMGSAGFIAGAFILAMAAIVASFKAFVSGAMRAEMAMMKFEALVKSTGMAAGMTANQLEHFSKQMAKDTLFSVQQVRDASGVMLTFKAVTGDAFGRSMHVAGDLAAILGTDLKSAVLQLGKALENPRIGLSMLRRSGVSFTDSQKNVINALSDTGQAAEAMDMILSAIEGQAGGVARAVAGSGEKTTLAGAFDELSRKLGIFQEEMLTGTSIIDKFKDAVLGLADAIPGVDTDNMSKDELEASRKEMEALLKEKEALIAEKKKQTKSGFGLVMGLTFGGENQIKMTQDDIDILEFKIKKVKKALRDIANVGVNEGPANPNLLPKSTADADSLSLIMTKMTKRTKAAERAQKALQVQTGKTGAELKTLQFKQQILNEIFKDGPELMAALTNAQKLEIDKMVEAMRKHAEATEELQKNYNTVKSAVDKAFDVMENSILSLIDGTKNLKDVMKEMLRAFVADLTVAIFKMVLLDRIKKSIMGAVSTAFQIPADVPLGTSASGGAIGSNQPMLVGERGPEIFMPRTAGKIVNSNETRSAMSGEGGGITVVQNNNFALGVAATARAEVQKMLPQIAETSKMAVLEASSRGGAYKKGLIGGV